MAEHSSRLQPSINLHAPVTGSAALVPMYYPGEMKARVGPVLIDTYSILAPTQDSNPGGRIQNHKRWPLHYHCTQKSASSACLDGVWYCFGFCMYRKCNWFSRNLELFSDVLNISDFTIHPIIDDVVDSESITIIYHTLAVMTTSNSKITDSLPPTACVFRLQCARVPFQAAIYGDPLICRNRLQSLKTQLFSVDWCRLYKYS